MACYWKQCEPRPRNPRPRGTDVGGSFIDVNVQSGNALEAESPAFVPAGLALALFSHLKAGWTPSEMPPVVRTRQTWDLPALRDFCLFSRHATPVIEGQLNPALKKSGATGTCGPRVNCHRIRSAGAPPLKSELAPVPSGPASRISGHTVTCVNGPESSSPIGWELQQRPCSC
jgi:hypothetical protein